MIGEWIRIGGKDKTMIEVGYMNCDRGLKGKLIHMNMFGNKFCLFSVYIFAKVYFWRREIICEVERQIYAFEGNHVL